MNVTHAYGTNVIEFEKHSDEALQKFTKEKEVAYFRHCMSPAYPQLGANVDWFSDKPLTQALNELAVWFKEGYTVATSLNRPLYLKVQLIKPQEVVEADLAVVVEEARAEYTNARYLRNVEETKRQIEISVARKERERSAAAAKIAAELQGADEELALADLLRAYSPKKASASK